MGNRIENDCVCCERCVNCGRKAVKMHYCDKCDEYADEWNPLYVAEDGSELCWDCYKEQFTEKICDDCDDTKCAHCGAEAEEMYLTDGEWVCEDCLRSLAEKVDMED